MHPASFAYFNTVDFHFCVVLLFPVFESRSSCLTCELLRTCCSNGVLFCCFRASSSPSTVLMSRKWDKQWPRRRRSSFISPFAQSYHQIPRATVTAPSASSSTPDRYASRCRQKRQRHDQSHIVCVYSTSLLLCGLLLKKQLAETPFPSISQTPSSFLKRASRSLIILS